MTNGATGNRAIAFVAMKFDSDHWRDKRYITIREELEQAGFNCLRADEISTSGAVVDEVCRLLKEATLVVIDSSGDSNSVSYEIGFCHGIGRSPNTTLLLRSDGNIPFNYRHYRHRVYKDIRHLRRLVRDYLKLYEPIRDDMYGYAFAFAFSEQARSGYIYDGAVCVFTALRDARFTGRAECYTAEQFHGRFFTVGLVLRAPSGRKQTPDYKWWVRIADLVGQYAQKSGGRITLDSTLSELAEKRAMAAWLLPCGIAEFASGRIVRLLGVEDDEMDPSSFFVKWIQRTAEEQAEPLTPAPEN